MIENQLNGFRSIYDSADPRLRILFATGFSVIVAVSHRFETLGCAFALAAVLLILDRKRTVDLVKKLRVLVAFLILIWIVLPLTFNGLPVIRLNGLGLSVPGIALAGQITIKSTAIILVFMLMMANLSIGIIGHSLEKMRVPSKLVLLILMTYRYIFIIEEEYQRLRRSAKTRGFVAGTNLHTYRTVANFIAVLFIRAYERAERINKAMKCRGFNGKLISLVDFSPLGQNKIFLVASVIMLIALVALEWLIRYR